MKKSWCAWALALALTLPALPSRAQEIKVAAASDLQFVLAEVASRFQKETGITAKISFGSSGNFFAQIQNGAPFDMFFSADVEYPQKLEAAGLAETGTLYRYAVGKLVLWVPNGSRIDIHQGLKALAAADVKKVAIANPAHAPYGRAAVAALRSEKAYDAVEGKLVMGENISQAATFAASGNADAGLLALSLALSPTLKEKGRYLEVPADEYPAIGQAAIILKSATEKAGARRFLEYIKTPPVVQIFKQYGFSIPSDSGQ